jgi:hypothetical protein
MMTERAQDAFVAAPPTLPCPKCGEFMAMSRLVMGVPGCDQRTFECRRCHVQETIGVSYRQSSPQLNA